MRVAPDPLAQLKTVDVGHHDIRDHQVNRVGQHHVKGLGAIGGGEDVKPGNLKGEPELGELRWAVFNHQHLGETAHVPELLTRTTRTSRSAIA